MARNLEPACKQCRRVGEKLFLKGEKCFTPKCPVVRRAYPPGMHGQQATSRLSKYGTQLREKQKAKKMYGLMENQFRLYFARAVAKPGNTGELLLRMLEQRLDNVVYRLGFAKSRAAARQMVRHGHLTVNGQHVDIPSYQVQVQDVVAIADAKKSKERYGDLVKELERHELPDWLALDKTALTGTVQTAPSVESLQQSIKAQLVVEFYSR
ncbi:MAG: 30S ribosomal protein S4 [Candidatus Kerfeldbacteria bacterium]|nr:30S ribosomal protein S4 [Candidatus Kerfeldbacteria bacterium]